MDSFVENYLELIKETESPFIYHRWSAIVSIGAVLGRDYYLQHGHFRIFPNLYCLLVGDPGTRKSSAIKLAKKFLSPSYKTFAHTRTKQEQFLADLEASTSEGFGSEATGESYGKKKTKLDDELWSGNGHLEPKEVFVVADEFSEFSGVGQAEFYTTLGNLWDYDDENQPFTQRWKTSKSVTIFQPTVSILGGTTPSKFAKIFPAEIIDDGFLSRLILIYGESSDRLYPFPPAPNPATVDLITSWYKSIRGRGLRAAELDSDAKEILTDIYLTGCGGVKDGRFTSYNNRRYTQLLKLCLISSVSRGTAPVITGYSVIEANTWLTAAEYNMGKAVGEFGKAKNSDVSNKLMEAINSSRAPVKAKELWRMVSTDLTKISELSELLNNLKLADKIQEAPGLGWLPVKQVAGTVKHVDWSLLTDEEQIL